MTRLTFASGTLAGSTLIAALLLPHLNDVPSSPALASPPPACDEIECMFVPSEGSIELEQKLERRGYICTDKAHLSESVIVDQAAGATIVPFDRAMRIARVGSGWMRSYCTQP